MFVVCIASGLFYVFCFQREFEENRNAELIETQRLEEQERRRREEKVIDISLIAKKIVIAE